MVYGPKFWEVHYPIWGGPLKHTTLQVFPLLPIIMKSSWPGLSFAITVTWGQFQETSQQHGGWSWKNNYICGLKFNNGMFSQPHSPWAICIGQLKFRLVWIQWSGCEMMALFFNHNVLTVWLGSPLPWLSPSTISCTLALGGVNGLCFMALYMVMTENYSMTWIVQPQKTPTAIEVINFWMQIMFSVMMLIILSMWPQ